MITHKCGTMMPDVDLSELARLDREPSETKRKIELTSDLIDQIVYKLYGLTGEEIAIVEGSTSWPCRSDCAA